MCVLGVELGNLAVDLAVDEGRGAELEVDVVIVGVPVEGTEAFADVEVVEPLCLGARGAQEDVMEVFRDGEFGGGPDDGVVDLGVWGCDDEWARGGRWVPRHHPAMCVLCTGDAHGFEEACNRNIVSYIRRLGAAANIDIQIRRGLLWGLRARFLAVGGVVVGVLWWDVWIKDGMVSTWALALGEDVGELGECGGEGGDDV